MGAPVIRGDFAELKGFAKKLEGLGKAVPKLAKDVAPALQDEINASARAGEDPYGGTLAPRNDGGQAFASVGGMFARVRARGAQIVASVTRRIPRFMNRGRSAGAKGGFMPPRPLIPDEQGAIPPAWEAILEGASRELGDKVVR